MICFVAKSSTNASFTKYLSTAALLLSVLSLPSRNVSSSGRKKPPAQHATSTINFSNQNLTFKNGNNV